MVSYLSAGIALIKEGCSRVPCNDHASGAVCCAVMWLCGELIEELGDDIQGAFSGGRFMVSYGAESNDQIFVNDPFIIY